VDVWPEPELAAIEPLPPLDTGSAVAMALPPAPPPKDRTNRTATQDENIKPTGLSVSAVVAKPGPTSRQNLLRNNEVLVQIVDTFVCSILNVSLPRSLASQGWST